MPAHDAVGVGEERAFLLSDERRHLTEPEPCMRGVESKLLAGLLDMRQVHREVEHPIALSKQDGQDGLAVFRERVRAGKDDLGRLAV